MDQWQCRAAVSATCTQKSQLPCMSRPCLASSPMRWAPLAASLGTCTPASLRGRSRTSGTRLLAVKYLQMRLRSMSLNWHRLWAKYASQRMMQGAGGLAHRAGTIAMGQKNLAMMVGDLLQLCGNACSAACCCWDWHQGLACHPSSCMMCARHRCTDMGCVCWSATCLASPVPLPRPLHCCLWEVQDLKWPPH